MVGFKRLYEKKIILQDVGINYSISSFSNIALCYRKYKKTKYSDHKRRGGSCAKGGPLPQGRQALDLPY